MEQGSWIQYHPLTTVTDGSSIEFDVSGTGEDYIDFAINQSIRQFLEWPK